jgi:anhydro-N-acetylmuramic acid kinase
MAQILKVVGLMSGTSLDGIDAAILETDGETISAFGPVHAQFYTPQERQTLKAALEAAALLKSEADLWPQALLDAQDMVTRRHAVAVAQLLHENKLEYKDIDLIGFHGQTVLHRPKEKWAMQIGSGADLATVTSVDVVCDFRSADVAAGGQGAPFVPLYHQALVRSIKKAGEAVAVLNIGGVSNVTYIGAENDILAFDTGPGNAPIDDWAMLHTGKPIDYSGALAAAGQVDETLLAQMLRHRFFDAVPPKSLDRDDFTLAPVRHLSPEDGAATLTAFTAAGIARSREHMVKAPVRWIVCGGGRLNPTLMRELQLRLGVPVIACDDLGWRGDFIEAEAFAFLAARSLRGLPLSLPSTTGVPRPLTGGRLFKAKTTSQH